VSVHSRQGTKKGGQLLKGGLAQICLSLFSPHNPVVLCVTLLCKTAIEPQGLTAKSSGRHTGRLLRPLSTNGPFGTGLSSRRMSSISVRTRRMSSTSARFFAYFCFCGDFGIVTVQIPQHRLGVLSIVVVPQLPAWRADVIPRPGVASAEIDR
jgi:hypothetical protein